MVLFKMSAADAFRTAVAALIKASCQPIFKSVIALYLLCDLLPDDVTRCTAEASTSKESKELMDGQVLRVLVIHVHIYLFIIFKLLYDFQFI